MTEVTRPVAVRGNKRHVFNKEQNLDTGPRIKARKGHRNEDREGQLKMGTCHILALGLYYAHSIGLKAVRSKQRVLAILNRTVCYM
jgi:hypothetical protein